MNHNGKLLFVPAGGLANRMKAVASAALLSKRTGVDLRVVWFQDWALHAPFSAIFRPIEGVDIREAGPTDYLVYDRPRRRNLFIPRLFQRLLFAQRIDEETVQAHLDARFDFDVWARGRRSWMSCFLEFGEVPTEIYGQLFHPVAEVMARVEAFVSEFSSHTIGFHIRRTDNRRSIEGSPLSLFIEAGQREVALHPDTRIFLATDDEATKRELTAEFGPRLIMQQAEAARGNIEGIRGGLVDMYTLARTHTVYGSVGSTFSVMATAIGGNRLEVLSL